MVKIKIKTTNSPVWPLPQFIPKSRLHSLLHSNTAFFLRLALLNKPNIVITDVPYRVY